MLCKKKFKIQKTNKMMKQILLSLVIAFCCSCKKYPEDSSSSRVRTAKKRLTCQLWFTSYAVNRISGVDYSGSQGNDNIRFNKNGEFNGESSILYGFNGNWEFTDDKNNLHIYNNSKSFIFKIIQLDASTLHLKNDSLDCYYH